MGRNKGEHFIEREDLIALVEKIQRRDEDSVDMLRDAVTGYLERYFRAKIPIYDLVEQERMLNDTIAIAYCNIDQLKTPEAFISWIRCIARGQIYRYHKKRGVERRRAERDLQKQAHEAERDMKREPELDLSNSEVLGAVNKLPEVQRQAVLLKMNGLKVREIAEHQRVSEGTVKSRLNYARAKLRKEGVLSWER